ncbi:hypothetical protein NMY22_g8938 [Coprinellus aureogranulatus]|nr:hypothetical protein NMY22_g8938 [Coprinellus aureogranulatus]
MTLNLDSTATDQLVAQAKRLIDKFASSDERMFRLWRASIELHRVLEAMLTHAGEAGGDKSQRYVSSTIVACDEVVALDAQDRGAAEKACLLRLRDIGILWLTEFLFVFKASHSRDPKQRREEIPTFRVLGRRAVETRPFMRQLLLRDGYEDIVSEILHIEHPCPPERNGHRVHLQACHILPRALGNIKEYGHEEETVLAATLDILSKYTYLFEALQMPQDQLANVINSPENGFLLQIDHHDGFDNLAWSLERVAGDTYKVKVFNPRYPMLRNNIDSPLSFRDRSSEIEPSHPPLPTPNPVFIAIHLVIAKVAHESGAYDFFEAIFERLGYPEMPPTLTWADAEREVAVVDTRELLEDAVGTNSLCSGIAAL